MAELEKNTAFEWVFKMVDATDFASPETGLTVTATISKDGGAFGALTGSPVISEISSGWYKVTVAAGDMNADVVVLRATASGAAATEEKLYPPTKIVNDLNDIAATAIVSSGAITTSAGAVSTVTSVTNGVTVSTNSDKTGYSISGTLTTLDALDTAQDTQHSTTQGKVDTAQADLDIITGATGVNLLAATQASIDAIEADTGELQTDWANGGRLDLLIDAILADTGELQTDWANGGRLDLLIDAIKAVTDLLPDSGALSSLATAASVAALNDVSAADVNAQVLDVIATDTFSKPGQETPSDTPTLKDVLMYVYKHLTNKRTQTATQFSLYNDDAATIDQKATFSDDGTTATTTELVTGP